MTHLLCTTCGYESWSWSAFEVDPVAQAFTTAHEGRGHQVVTKAQRKPKAA
jgi:hypothetical protein